jgi:hypothetical protein
MGKGLVYRLTELQIENERLERLSERYEAEWRNATDAANKEASRADKLQARLDAMRLPGRIGQMRNVAHNCVDVESLAKHVLIIADELEAKLKEKGND